jgi:hypothetical protein
MMNQGVDGSGSGMWSMGWEGGWGMGSGEVLIVVLVIFGVAALTKYVFFGNRQ